MKKLVLLFSLLSTAANAWTVGEVVYSKSCSPAMVVTEVLANDATGVRWFAGQTMLAATFPADTLTAYYPCPALAHAQAVINKTDNPPLPPDAP